MAALALPDPVPSKQLVLGCPIFVGLDYKNPTFDELAEGAN